MKAGDSVFVLSGLDVEEWEVYLYEDKLFIRRAKGYMGFPADTHHYPVLRTLDEAVAASRAERERRIRRCARELERLAINTNVKVRLRKPPVKGTENGR